MGTYTTNYNLFLPTIGEQGWGELVNGNFTTIDNTMSGLNTRVSNLESRIEGVEKVATVIGVDENQNVTFLAGVTVNGVVKGLTTLRPTNVILYTPLNFSKSGSINSVSSSLNYTIPAYKSNLSLPYDEIEYTIVTSCQHQLTDGTSTTIITVTDEDTSEVLHTKTLSVTGRYTSKEDTIILRFNVKHSIAISINWSGNTDRNSTLLSFSATTTAGTVYL